MIGSLTQTTFTAYRRIDTHTRKQVCSHGFILSKQSVNCAQQFILRQKEEHQIFNKYSNDNIHYLGLNKESGLSLFVAYSVIVIDGAIGLIALSQLYSNLPISVFGLYLNFDLQTNNKKFILDVELFCPVSLPALLLLVRAMAAIDNI